MGSDDNYDGFSNYLMMDGEPVKIGEFADLTADTTTESEAKSEIEANNERGKAIVEGIIDGMEHPVSLHISNMGAKTFTIPFEPQKPEKRHRCATRKRYIKLRMADGASRNRANTEAQLFAELVGFSYQEIYQQLPIMMSLLNVGFSLGHLRNWFSLNA